MVFRRPGLGWLVIAALGACSPGRRNNGGGSGGNGGAGNGGSGGGGSGGGGGAPTDKGSFSTDDCMGCMFPPDTAPPCGGGGVAVALAYPPEDVLLPPNMNSLSVQFTPRDTSVMMYEVAFKSSVSDIRIVTKCAKETVDTRAMPSGGCEVVITPEIWAALVKMNRGGSMQISVRTSTDGTCATSGVATRPLRFAEEDIVGTVYYWKSTVTPMGTGGHIWYKKWGSTDPEQQFTKSGMGGAFTSTCYGCHFLSHDAVRMVVGGDDNDSDDEYSDVKETQFDVATKMPIAGGGVGVSTMPPGFQAYLPDHTLLLASDGRAGTNRFLLYDGDTGAASTPASVTVGTTGQRPTMPDWSPDGKTLLFVMPTKVGSWKSGLRVDDDHVMGGSLYTMDYMGMGIFGPPVALITSAGENNYYPSYSPDGAFIVFDRVPLTGSIADPCVKTGEMGDCPNDSFSNRAARLMILPTSAGAMPIDPELANDSPAAAPVPVSNSWPRWTPYIQMYKGSKLLWVTFSSTRDYGVLVRNHQTGMDQCYPPDSLEWPDGTHGAKFGPDCHQPQIWMAPINLTKAGKTAGGPGGDPTLSRAFWLPFQDITTHNHTAQWTP